MADYRIKDALSEDDAYALVQRYSASTIFTMLQEISQVTENNATIDWRKLVKITSTGISDAREYQMLWRYLAYKDPLEKIEDGGEPLSDESDLECELEATPHHGEDVSTEIDCCVKILLSSGALGDCFPVTSIDEAPNTYTPNDPSLEADKQHLNCHNRYTNGGAPFAPKQQLSVGLSAEGQDGNGLLTSAFPAKKKRKLWTKEEDMELIAAVEKFGEGNWANILKGDFKHDRTASQLSQRWAIIRRRQSSSNQNSASKSKSEEMLAAQKAFSMALNMPMSGNLPTIFSAGGPQLQTVTTSPSIAAGGTSCSMDEPHAKQSPPPVNQEPSSPKRGLNISNKPQPSQKKPQASANPSICPNPLIKAAAYAAGGRIAPPKTAASFLKVAHSHNIFRFGHSKTTPITVGGSLRFSHPSTSKLCRGSGASGKPSFLHQPYPSSESKLARIRLQPNAKRRRGIIISAVDVDELLAEEPRGAQSKEMVNTPVAEIGGSSRDHGGEAGDSKNEGDGQNEEQPGEAKGGEEREKQSSSHLKQEGNR